MSETVESVSVEQAVVHALARRAGVEPQTVDVEASPMEIPGMDSLLVLKALVEIEDVCDMAIPDDVVFKARSVRHLAELIEAMRTA